MYPLAMARQGEDVVVRRIGGDSKIRSHLESLGFVAGAFVRVITVRGDNLIVLLKGSRLALNRSLAMKIEI